MSSMVGRILGVKSIREDRAQTNVKRCQLVVAEANAAIEQRRQELADFTRWRIAEEDRLWDEFEQRLVKLHDLDELKAEIGLLRGRSDVYEERIREAIKHRDEARVELENAEKALAIAIKGRQKFEIVADILDEEYRQEMERREEVELEDQMQPMSTGDWEDA